MSAGERGTGDRYRRWPAKTAASRSSGIKEVLDLADSELVNKVVSMSGGGVDVVYDLVGAATFARSVAAIRNGGDLVHYGSASGAPRVDWAALAKRGIAYTKPETADFIDSRHVLEEASAELWHALSAGRLPLPAVTQYPLRQARSAHEDILARRVTGSIVLTM